VPQTCLCPRCRRRVLLPSRAAGQTVACPGCGFRITVPSDADRADDADQPGSRWPGVLLALTAGMALVVAAGLILFAVLPRDSALGRLLARAPDTGRPVPATEKAPPTDERAVVRVEDKPADPVTPAAEERPAPAPRTEEPPPKEETPPAPKEEPPAKEQPAPAPPEPAKPTTIAIKRIDKLDDEDLRKELLFAPEVALDQVPGSTAGLLTMARELESHGLIYPGPVAVAGQRPDLAGMPLRMGLDCRLGKEPAENLQALSRKLRTHLEAAIPRGSLDPRPDPDALRRELLGKEKPDWLQPEAIPALLQLLQAEGKPVRLVLVELLAKIDHKRATEALAMRALCDLSFDVREAAVRALAGRPREDYRDLLLAGLRYPWLPLQAHAAEALVALGHQDAVPQLVEMLKETPGTQPFTVTDAKKKEVLMVRELVRVNHLANCVLCHAPSFDRGDLVRGAVPTPGQALPAPVTTPQYYDRGGSFVRADVTYLRQDFSVVQTVDNPGKWPANQRYDYLTRLRPLTKQEVQRYELLKKELPLARLREPLAFALRELTGKDGGTDSDRWLALLSPKPKEKPAVTPEPAAQPARAAPADWKQFLMVRGAPEAIAADRQRAKKLADELVQASEAERGPLLAKLRDSTDPIHTRALAEAIPRLTGDARQKAREALDDHMSRESATALRDDLGDESAEVRRAAAAACGKAKTKGHIPDLIPLLEDTDAAVAEAALASLKALTGQDFGPAAGAAPADRAAAVRAWADWWKKQAGS
jgi:HEAT repeat protein